MSLENVSTAFTGLDVNRGVHFSHPEAYIDFKSKAEAAAYLDRVKEALGDGYPEIFIPGARQTEVPLPRPGTKPLAGREPPKRAPGAARRDGNPTPGPPGGRKQTHRGRP